MRACRVCERKYRHVTKQTAKRRARLLRRRSGDQRIEHYACRFCSWWHVGTENEVWTIREQDTTQ